MTIRRSPRPSGRAAGPVAYGALARALDARDFERVALLIMLAAIDVVERGDADDLIDALAGERARHERA